MAMRRIGSKLSGVLLAAVLLAGAHDAAFADGAAGPAVAPAEAARPDPADAVYDETQPGADDPRVKEGFAAYQAGDFKKAYDIWLPLAEAGNAEAQFRVGRLYDFGEGLEPDGAQAIEWYRLAMRDGHIPAQFNLAVLYDEGKLVPANPDQAYLHYKSASENGFPSAQHNLGILYLLGKGVEPDIVRGLMWIKIASKQLMSSRNLYMELLDKVDDRYFITLAEKKAREWEESHSR